MTHHDTEPLDRDQLLRRLLGAEGPELSCEQCFELLDTYVELELDGHEADEQVPGMRAHLDGCSACEEEHDSLLALLRAEHRS